MKAPKNNDKKRKFRKIWYDGEWGRNFYKDNTKAHGVYYHGQ